MSCSLVSVNFAIEHLIKLNKPDCSVKLSRFFIGKLGTKSGAGITKKTPKPGFQILIEIFRKAGLALR